MVMHYTENQIRQVYANDHRVKGEPTAWLSIDYRQWLQVDHHEICLIKAAGRGKPRCKAPCPTCQSRYEKDKP